METKNIIIVNYSNSLAESISIVAAKSGSLNDNMAENLAIIKTINVLLESVRSQTVILQQAIDEYSGG